MSPPREPASTTTRWSWLHAWTRGVIVFSCGSRNRTPTAAPAREPALMARPPARCFQPPPPHATSWPNVPPPGEPDDHHQSAPDRPHRKYRRAGYRRRGGVLPSAPRPQPRHESADLRRRVDGAVSAHRRRPAAEDPSRTPRHHPRPAHTRKSCRSIRRAGEQNGERTPQTRRPASRAVAASAVAASAVGASAVGASAVATRRAVLRYAAPFTPRQSRSTRAGEAAMGPALRDRVTRAARPPRARDT